MRKKTQEKKTEEHDCRSVSAANEFYELSNDETISVARLDAISATSSEALETHTFSLRLREIVLKCNVFLRIEKWR